MKKTEFKKLIQEEIKNIMFPTKEQYEIAKGYFTSPKGTYDSYQLKMAKQVIDKYESNNKNLKETTSPNYEHMVPYTKDIVQVIKTLKSINDKIEVDGPLSEEIVDAIESLDLLYHNIIMI